MTLRHIAVPVATGVLLLLVGAVVPAAAQTDPCSTTNPPFNRVFGTPGDDVLVGTPEIDIICGFGGNDRIFGLDGRDVIDAGAGDDLVYGGNGDDVITAASGDNIVHGGNGLETITLGAGSDVVYGQGDGVNTVTSGAGDDVAWTGPGTFTAVDTGPGDDELYLNARQNPAVLTGPGAIFGDPNRKVQAGDGDDLVQLLAETPEDGLVVDLGAGNDRLLGTAGPDRVILVDVPAQRPDRSFVPATILLFDGDDYFVGDIGPELVYGGPGNDLLIGDPIVRRTGGRAGTGGRELFASAYSADHLVGGPGDDTLYGQAGPDILVGQGGADVLVGDNFPDNRNIFADQTVPFVYIVGEAGSMDDAIYAADDGSYDYVDAGVGNDYCKADAIDDTRRCEFP